MTIVANIIAIRALDIAARPVAMTLMPASFYSSAIVQLSWISCSLSQPSVKRAASIAITNCVCNHSEYLHEPSLLRQSMVKCRFWR